MSSSEDIGRALRAYRNRQGLRQAALAQRLGVAQSQISRWESGRDRPRAASLEAVRALVWGDDGDPLAALRHFVAGSQQHLLLIGPEHTILARSAPLAVEPGPLDRFGWVIDPAENPAFEPIYARYRALLARPDGVVGLEIELPFMEGGSPWLARIRKTIYRVAGLSVCLAEIAFLPRPAGISPTPTCREQRLEDALFADPPRRPLLRQKARTISGAGPAVSRSWR